VVSSSGLVVVLTGPLGAGKTVFVKGLAEGLGIDPAAVTSPTFAICNEYDTGSERRFIHVDCYRIGSVAELENAGLLDWLEPGALVALEWGERFVSALPADHLEVTIERRNVESGDPSQRRLNAVAFGPVSAAALAAWRERSGPEGPR
jgi:tRNA threonylcarbamoyladenosine biosynthesis protein TsaE